MWKMKKADLESRIDELTSIIWDYRRDANKKLERIEELEKENGVLNRRISRTENQVHFLAWMLAKEWVVAEYWAYWLEVRIEVPPKESDRRIM